MSKVATLTLRFAYARIVVGVSKQNPMATAPEIICAISAVGCEHPFHQHGDVGVVEHLQLASILIEDLCKGELFDGISAVVRRVKRDVF